MLKIQSWLSAFVPFLLSGPLKSIAENQFSSVYMSFISAILSLKNSQIVLGTYMKLQQSILGSWATGVFVTLT